MKKKEVTKLMSKFLRETGEANKKILISIRLKWHRKKQFLKSPYSQISGHS